jgi:hypothetical protein
LRRNNYSALLRAGLILQPSNLFAFVKLALSDAEVLSLARVMGITLKLLTVNTQQLKPLHPAGDGAIP